MPPSKPLTKIDVIQLLGDAIVALDKLRSQFGRQTKNRKKLDDFRDQLDTAQRKVVRNLLNDNTAQFKLVADELKAENKNLKKTIDDVAKVAETLENLVAFVGVITKLVALV